MKQQVLNHWYLLWIPITGLLLFVICFMAYSYWTFKKSNKKAYDQASLIPLEEPKKPKGLIRYSSENEIIGQTRQKLPIRSAIYATIAIGFFPLFFSF